MAQSPGRFAKEFLELLAYSPGVWGLMLGFGFFAAPKGTFRETLVAHAERLGVRGCVLYLALFSANIVGVNLLSRHGAPWTAHAISVLAFLGGSAMIAVLWLWSAARRATRRAA